MAYLRPKRTITPSNFLYLLVLQIALTHLGGAAQVVPADPYRNFVGEWTGVIDEVGKGHSKIRVTVIEEKSRNRMAWHFESDGPAETRHHKSTKWFTLDPVKESMSTLWDGENRRSFKTDGLSYFTQRGYGAFSALEVSWRYPKTFRCTFELGEENLRYLWEQSDGHVFKPYSVVQLRRVSTEN